MALTDVPIPLSDVCISGEADSGPDVPFRFPKGEKGVSALRSRDDLTSPN